MQTVNSLSKAEELYNANIGHPPTDVRQLFNFCNQQSIPFKYSQIKQWWNNGKIDNNYLNTNHAITSQKHQNSIPSNKPNKISVKRYKLLHKHANFIKLLKQEIKSYQSILSVFNGNISNIKNAVRKYKLFLHNLSLLNNINKVNEYLDTIYPLNIEIQLLWRIHLIHPIKYKIHCEKLFNQTLRPSYSYINFTQIKHDCSKPKIKHKHKYCMLIKEIFESIDFKTTLCSYLIWMKQILKLFDNEANILETFDIIQEYKDFFEYFFENKYLMRLIPTLKQSFVWYSHCLYPKTFHREISIKKYAKYIDLNYIIIQNYNQTNLIWNMIKNRNNNDDIKEDFIHKINHKIDKEYLICGIMDKYIKNIYIIPMDIINLIIDYFDSNLREYEKERKERIYTNNGAYMTGNQMVNETVQVYNGWGYRRTSYTYKRPYKLRRNVYGMDLYLP